MVDLRDITQGDTPNYEFEVVDADTEEPVAIPGSVVKFAAKSDPSLPNFKAEHFKTTYDADEIIFLDAGPTKYLVQFTHEETKTADPARLDWDTQITRPLGSITTAGSLAVDPVASPASEGLIELTGTGVDFSSVRAGDILVPAGALTGNDVRCTIEEVDAGAGTLKTDYLSWSAESGIAFEIFRGDVVTPEDGAGCVTIKQGVTG